jgi:hypothetical protein
MVRRFSERANVCEPGRAKQPTPTSTAVPAACSPSGLVPCSTTRKGEDDTAITLYVGFFWDPDRASFTKRLTRPLVEAYAGEEAPGRVLAYVFGGAHEPGEVAASPHLGPPVSCAY